MCGLTISHLVRPHNVRKSPRSRLRPALLNSSASAPHSQTGPASVSPKRRLRSSAPQPQTHPVSASPPRRLRAPRVHPTRKYCSHQFPPSSPLGEPAKLITQDLPAFCANNFPATGSHLQTLLFVHTRVVFTPISTFLPPWRACEAFRGQRLACSRQLPHCRSQRTMGLHGIHQPVGSNNRRPRLETVAALTAVSSELNHGAASPKLSGAEW
jgi:hypothetical protein